LIDCTIKRDVDIHWKVTASCTHIQHTILANKNSQSTGIRTPQTNSNLARHCMRILLDTYFFVFLLLTVLHIAG